MTWRLTSGASPSLTRLAPLVGCLNLNRPKSNSRHSQFLKYAQDRVGDALRNEKNGRKHRRVCFLVPSGLFSRERPTSRSLSDRLLSTGRPGKTITEPGTGLKRADPPFFFSSARGRTFFLGRAHALKPFDREHPSLVHLLYHRSTLRHGLLPVC